MRSVPQPWESNRLTALKTVSMYLRAAETEAEEAGESTDGMASSVSELRDKLLDLTGNRVDIQLDEDTFKSTYQILKELSEVWDDLTDISQANILELIGGKRNANVVSALLNNFSIAEEALQTSLNAEGSALAENEKYLDSVQGKIEIMKASFETLSSDFISSDFLKFFVEGATGALNFLDAVVELTDSLGGMKTILTAIVGLMVTKKLSTIASFFKGDGKGKLSTFFKNLGQLPTALGNARAQGEGLSAALKAAGFSATALQAAFGAITIALTAAVAAYSHWRQNIEQERQEAIEQAKTTNEEADNIRDLYAAYQEASDAYRTNTGSKDSLTEATNNLLSALGVESDKVKDLVVKYGSLDAAINQLTLDSMVQAVSDAQSGLNAAYDNLMDTFGNGNDFWANVKSFLNVGTGSDILSLGDGTITELNTRIQKLLSDAGFELNWTDTMHTGYAALSLDNSSVDKIIESYDMLVEAKKLLQESLTTEEYNDSFAVDAIEGKITVYESVIQEYLDARDLLNESLAKQDVFTALFENGIPETTKDLEALKSQLISTAEESGRFEGTSEDIESAFDTAFNSAAQSVAGLQDVMNTTADVAGTTAAYVSDQYAIASGAISQNIEEASDAATTLINGITAAQDAVGSQQAGKSISFADFNSDELADYRSALELVNGTMQLNAEEVREIAQAKADEQVAINNTNKALEQTKYLENAKKIERLRQSLKDLSSENWAKSANSDAEKTIRNQIDALLEENKTIAETCDQYDLLSASIQEAVGAYQNWLNAQSSSDYGDMADDSVDAIKRINDTFDPDSDIYGNYGSQKFSAALDLVIPDSIDRENLDAVETYMENFKQYLTFDDNGDADGLNIDKFLEKSVEAGLMSYSKDDGFQILGNKKMKDFAEGLNMSSGMVQAFFDELNLKGGKFDWTDEAVKTMGDLAVKAGEGAEALRSLDEYSDLKIKTDVSDLSTTDEQLSTLDATIAEMNGVKAKVNIDSSEAEYANDIIQYCVAQKQLLTQPDVMQVDTSQVEGDLGEALSLLQQFQQAQNLLEQQIAIGADTTEAQASIDSLATEIQNLPVDTKVELGLDTTSVESIKSSIASLSADTMITIGVDASAVEGYNPDDKTVDVTYNPDTSALPTSIAVDDVTVTYEPDTRALPNYFPTITRYVNYVAVGAVNKTGSLNGTAHAGGTALARGDWGTAPGGRTLVGELGKEIIVDPRTGQWYTVGDNGAEFRNIPAGAIVFNHKQTESLLANGYVAGRASALVGGTAMVTGGYKPYTPHNGGGGSSSGSSSGSSYSNYSNTSSSSSSSSDEDDDDSEIIDWIEIAIDRIERAINRLATIATSPFRNLADRLGATNDEISQLSSEISLQQSAYDRYLQQANSVGLSEDLAAKVRDGTIDITEYDGDTAENIKSFQEWYEKALDCNDAILELSESLAELYQDKFDNTQNDFENQLSLLEHMTNVYNNGIDNLEERGYLASTRYYEALGNVEKQNIDILNQELSDLTAKMSEAVNSGAIEEGSEAWYEFQQNINEVKESIQESQTELVKFNNEIREINWERFDYLQEQISNITEETEFLIDLMENSDLYTDNGQLTDTGMATMGLHGQNYNVYMAQADKYAEELLKINQEIAEDPNNTKLLDRREELLEAQRDSILAAEDEKQAIVDMVKEGINLELDALQDLIDKYEESMDSAKDLYDYQKKLKDQTSEIAKLQKQLAAYSGDDSEENRATVQKIKVDLADAMEDLEETQYENYISEQKKLLDNLYDEYEAVLNERLDNVDALISDMIDSINTNSASIADTLATEAGKVGYVITDNEKAIWSNEGGAFSIITKYGESFLSQMTSVNDVMSKIAIKIGAMVTESEEIADTTIDTATPSTPATVPSSTPTPDSSPDTDTGGTSFTEDIKRGIAAAVWIYGSGSGWGNNPTRNKRLTEKFGAGAASAVQSYINAHGSNGDLYKYWVETGKSKLSQYYYSAFKKGGLADYTGIAWMDGTKTEPEMVLDSKDTSNFIALKDAMRSIADGNSPLSDLFSENVDGSGILSKLAKIEAPLTSATGTSIGDITYQVTIPIDHVQDYEDFMNQMRKDGKFEKMVQSMTVDRLVGGSKLSKNKYKW